MVEPAAPDASSQAQTGQTTAGAALQGRPPELEDWLNGQIYHPLSMRLARALALTPITPNMVSIAGGLSIVLAALVYWFSTSWTGVLLALIIHISWHVFDGADGDLARLTKRTSSTGEVIDGICDIVGHIILYVMLGVILAQDIGSFTAWILAVGAGAGRIVQAAHYEVQRRQYQYWVYDKTWLRVAAKGEGKPPGIFGLGAVAYVTLGRLFAPGGQHVDELVEAGSPAHKSALRDVIREETVPVLRSTYLLSANYRTLVCGISMLAGSPLYFFMFEAVGLTLVLVISILTASRATRRIQHQAKSLR
ncbi:MAG: CDP-alcohol phosphatidyltransferase family protein [Pseudomonadota bacterium]